MKRSALLALVFTACTTGRVTPPAAPSSVVIDLAARRAQMLEWLREYREAGAYPTDAAGNPLSVFVDAKGVRCPMAELIHKSGRDDLVDAVHREGNAVRLADVHDGPLYDWMLSSGLTEEEIALVQGAVDIRVQMQFEEQREIQLASMIGEVRGKLESAEAALRQATAHGLEVAVARLPHEHGPDELAHEKVAGNVLGPQAIAAALLRASVAPTLVVTGGMRGSIVLDGVVR
jgi:hypothetical protein